MLIDFNKAPTTLASRKYDVCVVGSGPAGVTVARELAAGGQRVALLEAGGTERTDRSQAIYRGEETGLKTWNAIEICRLRYLGGTSNHWSGLCGVFDESAFWPKRHHDLPGWPIERKDLLAFLPRALEILDLGAVDFSPRAIVASKPSRFETTTLHMSPPTRFGTKYGKELAESSRIDLYLNANVIDLQLVAPTTASPRVATALVRNYDKGVASVQASRFVLAMGSIENARLLLNSNRQIEAGIGNETDWVGRCFMEHLNVQVGRFVVRDREFFKSNSSAFSPSQEMMRQLRIGSGVLALNPDYMPRGYTGRLGKVKDVLRDTACRFETIREYTRKFADYNCEGDGVITSLIEQVPDRDSRVTLQPETDEFGKRRAHLHWVINDADRRTIRTIALEMARELLDLDVARVKLSPFITDVDREIELSPHCHQMGTTRMSKDPRYGVVDPNCKVHSVANLYIAGSSVFSTGGGINPTLTVVMQALRLGQHLRSA